MSQDRRSPGGIILSDEPEVDEAAPPADPNAPSAADIEKRLAEIAQAFPQSREHNCANCACSWFGTNGTAIPGTCRAEPPKVTTFLVPKPKDPRVVVVPGQQGGHDLVPVPVTHFPEIAHNSWCINGWQQKQHQGKH